MRRGCDFINFQSRRKIGVSLRVPYLAQMNCRDLRLVTKELGAVVCQSQKNVRDNVKESWGKIGFYDQVDGGYVFCSIKQKSIPG